MFKDPARNMGLIESSKKAVIFTSEHDSLIRTAFNMFKDKPIFGHGPKMFRAICKDEKYATGVNPCMTHPHNFYIQLLAETGIIGFSFLFIVLVYVIFQALRQFKCIILKQKRPLSDYQICLLAGILVTIWPLTTNGNFFNNWLSTITFFSIAILIWGLNKQNFNQFTYLKKIKILIKKVYNLKKTI